MTFLSYVQNTSTECFKKISWLPGILTRLTLAAVFIQAGWGKLHNLSGVTAYFTELGIPLPGLQAPFVATVEFGGGIFILLGILSRSASALLTIVMIVAIYTAKMSEFHELTDLFAFSEYLYIILFLWLIISGPGKISIESLIFRRK